MALPTAPGHRRGPKPSGTEVGQPLPHPHHYPPHRNGRKWDGRATSGAPPPRPQLQCPRTVICGHGAEGRRLPWPQKKGRGLPGAQATLALSPSLLASNRGAPQDLDAQSRRPGRLSPDTPVLGSRRLAPHGRCVPREAGGAGPCTQSRATLAGRTVRCRPPPPLPRGKGVGFRSLPLIPPSHHRPLPTARRIKAYFHQDNGELAFPARWTPPPPARRKAQGAPPRLPGALAGG